MNRDEMMSRLAARETPTWDILIIGGGATGLGCAVDAAARGYRTLLLERGDFAQGTSSRSTKLIHGGVRYLQQGNLKLVRESLRERGLLLRNARHLVTRMSFILPAYKWWEPMFYGMGLRIYDVLAAGHGIGHSQLLSQSEVQRRIPTIATTGLRGGTLYHDAQFDDARLAIALARTAAEQGATVINYFKVSRLLKNGGAVSGAVATDTETGREYEIPAKAVINATGVFTDSIRCLDDRESPKMIAASRGSHIVLDRQFLFGQTALIIPKTDDGRVLFAIPWHGKALVGTTDVPVDEPSEEPKPATDEIDFLLEHAGRYFTSKPTRKDVLSTFAGLRPLVKQANGASTAFTPRDHTIVVSPSKLVTITGGKWTTYRKMAEETINRAAEIAGLARGRCITSGIAIHGGSTDSRGEDETIVQAAREEMARTVADVLARRTRALFLDARASIVSAPAVAKALARELGRDEAWEKQQIEAYRTLARDYVAEQGSGL